MENEQVVETKKEEFKEDIPQHKRKIIYELDPYLGMLSMISS